MKSFITFFILLGCISWGWGQSVPTNKNYIQSTTARVEVQTQAAFNALSTKEDKQVQVQYFDELGRPIQGFDWKSAPNGEDIIQVQTYDNLGRTPTQYLPFVKSQNATFIDPTTALTDQANFYLPNADHASDPFPQAVSQFEASPLSRVIEQGAPGQTWQPNGTSAGIQGANEHTVIQAYKKNDVPVRVPIMYQACQSVDINYNYPVGSLMLAEMTDENGFLTRTYTDKLGQTILQGIDDGSGVLVYTAYVYDCSGRVKHVIQPEAYDALIQGNWSSTVVDQYVFQYVYDARGRVIEKKVPGADWVYMVYDNLDRLVLSQDGAQRAKTTPEWSFTMYDELNRPIITGLYKSSDTHSSLQTIFSSPSFTKSESPANNSWTDMTGEVIEGYTMTSYCLPQDLEVHAVTYYDDYDLDSDGTVDYGIAAVSEIPNLTSLVNARTHGMITAVKVRVLNPDPDMPTWLNTVTFYDKYGREIQTLADNHLALSGSFDRTSYDYNFVGELLKSVRTHSDGMTQTKIVEDFVYDHRGRLLQHFHQMNNQDRILLTQNTYNKLGQLVVENLHSEDNGANFLQNVDRKYNIRSWMTDINDVDSICPSGTPQELNVAVTSITVDFDLNNQVLGGGGTFGSGQVGGGPGGSLSSGDLGFTVSDGKSVTFYDPASQSSYQTSPVYSETQSIDFHGDPNPNLFSLPDPMVITFTVPQVIGTTGWDAFAQNLETAIINALAGTTNLMTSAMKTQLAQQIVSNYQTEVNNILAGYQATDLFAMRLHYEDGLTNLNSNAAPQYNGNISGLEWTVPGSCDISGYGFAYDGLNRLTQAASGVKSGTSWTHDAKYSTAYTYDLNGNILTLVRNGMTVGGATPTFGGIDNLSYTYQGNRLQSVADAITGNFAGIEHFRDGNTGTDYAYDASGNMIQDQNRNLNVIYNHMNKPVSVIKDAFDVIAYIYSADGTKLRQKVLDNSVVELGIGGNPLQKVTDYVAGFQYEDADGGGSQPKELIQFAHAKGRAIASASGFQYQYNLTDHLGNVRVVFGDGDGDGRINPDPVAGQDVSQVTQGYYPFGMRHGGSLSMATSPENQYLYNGKEMQDELGLGWYDYGFRMYDATIGRWNGVDALAEKYTSNSTYNYAVNNPLFFVDPDGRYTISHEEMQARINKQKDRVNNEKSEKDEQEYISSLKKRTIVRNGEIVGVLNRKQDNSWNAELFINHVVHVDGKVVGDVRHELTFESSTSKGKKWRLFDINTTEAPIKRGYSVIGKSKFRNNPNKNYFGGKVWLGFHIKSGNNSFELGGSIQGGNKNINVGVSGSYRWDLSHTVTIVRLTYKSLKILLFKALF
ncbi:MAG: DUF6443 domain-containing protein [Bacteroidota bacterium]